MAKSFNTATLTLKSSCTVGELIRWLGKQPTQGKVTLSSSPYQNQFDIGEDRIKVTWEEEDDA